MTEGTKIKRFQTEHLGEFLASQVLEARRGESVLSGGGVLQWNNPSGTDTGTFTWDSDLFINLPGITGRIEIAADTVGVSIDEGQYLYILLPRLTGDQEPEGTWNGVDPYVVAVGSTVVGTPPVNESLFVIGYHTEENTLILRDKTIMRDGVPGGLGHAHQDSEQWIKEVPPAPGSEYTLPFDYLPGKHQIAVYVNGNFQHPTRSDGSGDGDWSGGVPELYGYVEAADAHYKEVQGTGVDPYYNGIDFLKLPAEGEIILVRPVAGSQGPPGPPGAGGLDKAYEEEDFIELDDDGGGGGATATVNPVTIKEPLESVAFDALRDYKSDLQTSALELLRSALHPTLAHRDTQAFWLSTAGDAGTPALFLYNPRFGATLESELLGTSEDNFGASSADEGIWCLSPAGQRDHTEDSKIALTFIRRDQLPDAVAKLAGLRKGDNPFGIGWDVGDSTMYGQVLANKYGELATGQGRDFLRWYILDVTWPPFAGDVDTVVFVIDETVIEHDAQFLGCLATVPYNVGPDAVEGAFHANPPNFPGTNPHELKVELYDTTPRTLHLRYGSELIGGITRLTLFFTKEWSAAEEGVYPPP